MHDNDLQCRIAFHDRETDQGRSNEHVIVEPGGEDRRQRMAERCCSDEGGVARGRPAGKRSTTPARDRRLCQPVLDLLEERPVRGPFGVPQAGCGVDRRRDPEPLELGP